MKTATVRDLRNRYTSLLRWISAGEEILITQHGVVIARLSPETAETARLVNWADAPEVRRDRSHDPILSAAQSEALIADAGGKS
jgi:antitoxin (DNA-binding transcriptional repressor) of toxin-antitoxin stability system